MTTKNLFFFCGILFVTHQLLQKIFQVSLPFLDNYLDPALLMPIALQLISWERKWWLKKSYYFSFIEIIIWTIFISVVAEYFFPKINSKFTADFWDVLLYFFGAILYYFFQQKTNKKSSQPFGHEDF